MDPTDKELREKLAPGPFARDGFDERLRKRIEDSLDRPRKRFGRTTRFGWNAAGAAALLLLLIGFGIWQWSPLGSSPSGAKDTQLAGALDPKMSLTAETDEEIRSALLLGLRKDVTAPDGRIVSSYRTVLVAPEDNKLQITAEGSGIVMPYGQTFWKIESTADDGTSDRQSLIAYQAYGRKALTERPASILATPREGLLSERILFVGNRYVSIAQDAVGKEEGDDREYRFVKQINQLAKSGGTAFDPATEPHTALEEALAQAAAVNGEKTEQWAIVRKPGKWIGVTYGRLNAAEPVDANAEQEVQTELPEDVAPADQLLVSWDQIRRIEPAATDAYTSKSEDMLAVVVDREIKIYPYKQKNGLSNPLSVELEPNETVIMVEWALNQSEQKNYADQWKTKVSEILSKR